MQLPLSGSGGREQQTVRVGAERCVSSQQSRQGLTGFLVAFLSACLLRRAESGGNQNMRQNSLNQKKPTSFAKHLCIVPCTAVSTLRRLVPKKTCVQSWSLKAGFAFKSQTSTVLSAAFWEPGHLYHMTCGIRFWTSSCEYFPVQRSFKAANFQNMRRANRETVLSMGGFTRKGR
jgi:hypothetical protein